MRLLARILGRKAPEVPPFAANACVYYNEQGILVTATNRDTRGWQFAGEPMALLARDAGDRDLGEAVLAALRGSRDQCMEAEFEAQPAAVLRLAGERSWNTLEKRWQLAMVYWGPGGESVVVATMRQHRGGGYHAETGDAESRCDAGSAAIGAVVRGVVSGPTVPRPRRRGRDGD